MSPENKKRIQDAVALAGKDLEGKLKPLPEIPNRNSYARLWKAIKTKFGKTYKECDNAQVDEILSLIEFCRQNPED